MATTSTAPEPVYRKDYRPADFRIEAIELDFQLDHEETLVRARYEIRRNPDADAATDTIELNGEELDLRGLRLNGTELVMGEFEVGPETLTIPGVPEEFELETEVAIRPRANTKLIGLFASNEVLCTQCEAEGFRRITYSLDRPDVMARYTVRIEADRKRYPVLLSNGNRVAEGELPNGRHWVKWQDPFPKPSYLFALVAGPLVCHRGAFTTRSGRDVQLEIWVEPENAEKCEHALESLRAAMKWDEDVFGLEYDLDVYMIVAVNDFNMGAMENKGLNIFNSKYVLARPETATDDDYEAIEGVIGHEYFHNWTGNRVTCRDWFQLTLKEGLTVFRDQEFSADCTSAPVKRIQDVRGLRTVQFSEDAGPMAHPIRPESYIEMSNFYTATVYEKGAEVIRLYQTLLGADGFRKGLDLYFERHDGQAVTCDDFRRAMADANGADLDQLERWYQRAGTPTIEARGQYDEELRAYDLTLKQSAPSGDAQTSGPFHVPVRVGLVGPQGTDFDLELEGDPKGEPASSTRVLELRTSEETFRFVDVPARPVPSIGRGFSAPVRFRTERGREELAFLMAHDSDPFNRWDAGQELGKRLLLELARANGEGRDLVMDEGFIAAFAEILRDTSLDGSIKALTLSLPNEEILAQEMHAVDPEAIHGARRFAIRELARALREELFETYEEHSEGSDAIEKPEIDRRRIKNRALAYLVALEEQETTTLAADQFASARCMTDYEAAFFCLMEVEAPERAHAIEAFHTRWHADPLVLDKWFRMQAYSSLPSTLERVVELSEHPDFNLKNPNRARSLLGSFASGNQVRFHRPDGAGYAFVADKVLELDAMNPQVASRLVSAFNPWRRFEAGRRGLMKTELERIAAHPGLSKDVTEIVGRALKSDDQG